MVVVSHQPLTKVAGGAAALALLDADPHVVAALAGDSHHNRIAARSTRGRRLLADPDRVAGRLPPAGPRAARARDPGGGTVLETWMLDTAPDPLADTARELAFLDAQGGRPQHEAGTPPDRNAGSTCAESAAPSADAHCCSLTALDPAPYSDRL